MTPFVASGRSESSSTPSSSDAVPARRFDAPRPEIHLEIRECSWGLWNDRFKRHHYLVDSGPMAFAKCFAGYVDGEPVCFVGVSGMVTGQGNREARFCRFVTLPEWQGAGVGMRFLETLTERELQGRGFIGSPTTSIIHSAHPALAVTLRRSPRWRQISQALHGGAKDRVATGMGGHARAVMGFRYGGQRYADAFTGEIISKNRKVVDDDE